MKSNVSKSEKLSLADANLASVGIIIIGLVLLIWDNIKITKGCVKANVLRSDKLSLVDARLCFKGMIIIRLALLK